jgi:hypothetical protein
MSTAAQHYGMARGRSAAELTFTSGSPRGEAVVLFWRPETPWVVAASGPFESKSQAQRWGRKNHPRRHVVVGLHNIEEA